MTNFEVFKNTITEYLQMNNVSLLFVSNLHDTSLNDSNKKKIRYVYNGQKDLDVIDMDLIAKKGYKIIKSAEGKDNIINTADAFLVNDTNQWFFVEFKDSEIKSDNSGLKNNVLKKAYSNLYMLLDIMYTMKEAGKIYSDFSFDNPIKFAKENIHYILVCSSEKNSMVYKQVKNCELIGERYTPVFMQRLKDYLFKEAYVYTEQIFEQKFVNKFIY